MKRVSIVAFGLVCSTALGQGLQTVSYSTKQQALPPPALRATANLVVVDVVVRDKAGHAIKGLKQDDFVLTEDKTAQRVNHFEEHTSAEIVPVATALPKLPAGVFTNFAPAPAKGPLNVLMFDKFNTQMADQAGLRLQMLKFIDEAKPGTRLAILELTDRVRLLQGFTDDRELLRAALRDRNAPVLETRGANSNVTNDGCSIVGFKPDACQSSEFVGMPNSGMHLDCESMHAHSRMTRAAMQFLALYLGNIPGRKNLLWFSGLYPFHLYPDQDGPDKVFPQGQCQVSAEELRQATAKLADNHVSIYPVGVHPTRVAPLGGDGIANEMVTTENLTEFAAETGGKAFLLYPGVLNEEAEEAIEDGSNFYTLTYTPQNPDWSDRYRKIEVKLAGGRKADLSFRQGYYAIDPNKPVKTAIFGKAVAPTKDARPDAMQMALMLGVPAVGEISLVARVLPGGSAGEGALAAGNEGSNGLSGPYQRYTVRLAIDLHTLKLSESTDGSRHGALEYVTFVYDLKGNVINSVGRTAKVDLKANAYAGVLSSGLPLEAEISVPAKGEYTFRIAVHDLGDDRVGSVEVPVSAVRNLAAAK